MPRRSPGVDPDEADGALECAEERYRAVPCYHDGWHHLHPEDQADFLAGLSIADERISQLVAWHRVGHLEADHALRLQELLALRGSVGDRLAGMRSPDRANRPTHPASPWVLDD